MRNASTASDSSARARAAAAADCEVRLEILKLLSYDFIKYALIVGTMVALCSSLLGTSLVLRRFSMIGDGLSHVAFGAMAISAALGAQPTYVALPIVIAAAFILLQVSERGLLSGDSAIALISTSALALGVFVTSVTGANFDLTSYLFGSILAISKNDVWFSVVLCIVVLMLFMFAYNKIFAITFDESFSKATGVRTSLYNMLIAVLTAVTVVLGMRLMGAMLISSFIIFPALSSMRVCKRFKGVVVLSACLAVLSVVAGIVISCVFDNIPTGAVIVLINLAFFLVMSLLRKIKRS